MEKRDEKVEMSKKYNVCFNIAKHKKKKTQTM